MLWKASFTKGFYLIDPNNATYLFPLSKIDSGLTTSFTKTDISMLIGIATLIILLLGGGLILFCWIPN